MQGIELIWLKIGITGELLWMGSTMHEVSNFLDDITL
jgi:hypothetical protein